MLSVCSFRYILITLCTARETPHPVSMGAVTGLVDKAMSSNQPLVLVGNMLGRVRKDSRSVLSDMAELHQFIDTQQRNATCDLARLGYS